MEKLLPIPCGTMRRAGELCNKKPYLYIIDTVFVYLFYGIFGKGIIDNHGEISALIQLSG